MSATKAKRNGKRTKYDVRWREGGQHRSRSFDKKGDADDFRAEVRRRRQRGQAIVRPNETPTLDAFANGWQRRRKEDGAALETRKGNRSTYNNWISPYLGGRHVGELRVKVLDEWRADLRSDGASIYTQRRATMVLAMILDDVVRREEGLTGNPVRALPAVSGHERRKGQAASPEQVEAMRAYFLEAKRPADAAFISILAYVGLRPEEARALVPGNLIHRGREFDLRADQTKHKTPARTPTIPAPIRPEIRAFVKGLPAGGQQWTPSGIRNWRRRHFKPAAAAAGLPEDFRPYDLRHTCASLMLRAGIPAPDVAEHMGHSLETLLSVYAHAIKAMKGKPAEPLDKAIRAARGTDRVRSVGKTKAAKSRRPL
jgi:integrase